MLSDRLWLRQACGRSHTVWEIEFGRRVPLDRYPDTYDWLVKVLPGDAPSLCTDDEGLVLRAHVDDPGRHPVEVADTEVDVALWTIPIEVFDDLDLGREDELHLRDFIHSADGVERFYLVTAPDGLPRRDDGDLGTVTDLAPRRPR